MIKEIQIEVEVTQGTEFSDDLNTLFDQHGGNPKISGVVRISVEDSLKPDARCKLEFPDGFIDYCRLNLFHKYYHFKVA